MLDGLPKPDFAQNGYALYHGDCLAVLPTLLEGFADSVICDPPYELGFMSQDWDKRGVSFDSATWAAVRRCAKPGALLLAFGGTRTWHRIAVAIEDAGWEIRDTICWLHSQGFPKALDVSKAIDKAAGAKRERRVVRSNVVGSCFAQDAWTKANRGTRLHASALTEAAGRWSGWQSALKPAFEPIIVAMNPLDGTYAHNALTHGVAGFNVDGSRIGIGERIPGGGNGKAQHGGRFGSGEYAGERPVTQPHNNGRYPANVIHDGSEEVVEAFPQSNRGGRERNGVGQPYNGVGDAGKAFKQTQPSYHDWGDSGSAARFFYACKASPAERDGCKHPTMKPISLLRYLARLTKTPTGGVVLDPFMGAGSLGVACGQEGREYVGIELERRWFDAAVQSIAGPLFTEAAV